MRLSIYDSQWTAASRAFIEVTQPMEEGCVTIIAPLTFPVGRQELTIPEAAARLRMSEADVRKLIADGTLDAVDVGNGLGFWRLPFLAITAFEARPKGSPARRAKTPQDDSGRLKTLTGVQKHAQSPAMRGRKPSRKRSEPGFASNRGRFGNGGSK